MRNPNRNLVVREDSLGPTTTFLWCCTGSNVQLPAYISFARLSVGCNHAYEMKKKTLHVAAS